MKNTTKPLTKPILTYLEIKIRSQKCRFVTVQGEMETFSTAVSLQNVQLQNMYLF